MEDEPGRGPNWPFTNIASVNNNRLMTGNLIDYSTNTEGPGFFLNSGTFTEFSIPGSTQSQGNGINDDAQIVGLNTGSQPVHGLVMTPPH